jgi:hypothetical protein
MTTISTVSAAKLLGITLAELRRKLRDSGLTADSVPLSWVDRELKKTRTTR